MPQDVVMFCRGSLVALRRLLLSIGRSGMSHVFASAQLTSTT